MYVCIYDGFAGHVHNTQPINCQYLPPTNCQYLPPTNCQYLPPTNCRYPMLEALCVTVCMYVFKHTYAHYIVVYRHTLLRTISLYIVIHCRDELLQLFSCIQVPSRSRTVPSYIHISAYAHIHITMMCHHKCICTYVHHNDCIFMCNRAHWLQIYCTYTH